MFQCTLAYMFESERASSELIAVRRINDVAD